MSVRRRISLCIVLALIAGCSTTRMRETKYDAGTGQVSVKNYSGYFESRSIFIPDLVGVHLVVDVEKRTIPIGHQLAQAVGALGPGDTEATGLFTAYIHNMTAAPQIFTFTSMLSEQAPLPAVPVTVSLPADSYQKVVLGRVPIFSYAKALMVEVKYEMGNQHFTKQLIAQRKTQEELDAEAKRWKGKKKNVPEFFPD
jgi:hypothetical protein